MHEPVIEAIQDARNTGRDIPWVRADGSPEDLSGVTIIDGTITHMRSGVTRAITGNLSTAGDPSLGILRWAFGEDDVATPGLFLVQFRATFGQHSDATFAALFRVHRFREAPI